MYYACAQLLAIITIMCFHPFLAAFNIDFWMNKIHSCFVFFFLHTWCRFVWNSCLECRQDNTKFIHVWLNVLFWYIYTLYDRWNHTDDSSILNHLGIYCFSLVYLWGCVMEIVEWMWWNWLGEDFILWNWMKNIELFAFVEESH